MNQARKNRRVASSDPAAVLRGISAVGFDLSEVSICAEEFDSPQIDRPTNSRLAQPNSQDENGDIRADVDDTVILDAPSLRINPESTRSIENEVVDVIENQIESAKQVQQLASRLKENEAELNRRADELESRIAQWTDTQREQESLIEKRLCELSQQSSQVKCQQLHLMQLQTDIVKSQNATRTAIETIVIQCDSDVKTMTAMKSLKQEISGRFDFIARRWEHLSNLMQQQRDQESLDKAG